MILHGLGAFPLRRDGRDFEAVRSTLRELEKDRCVGVFPEGSRSLDGCMRKVSAGVAYLALKSQAPILPVAIWGTEKIPPLWRTAFAFNRLNVRIGQTFTFPPIEGNVTRPVLEHLSDTVMLRIAAMLPESYRGYYSLSGQGAGPNYAAAVATLARDLKRLQSRVLGSHVLRASGGELCLFEPGRLQ